MLNIISPHPDDAALSIACTLSVLKPLFFHVNLVSCFTRTNWAPYLSDTSSVEDVAMARRREDEAFIELLGGSATLHSLGMLDAPLRPDWNLEGERLKSPDQGLLERCTAALRDGLANLSSDGAAWAIPLALRHRDHFITRAAALAVAGAAPLFFYEEVPYAFTISEQKIVNRVNAVEALIGRCLSARRLSSGVDIDVWRRSARCYPSQFSEEEVMSMSSSIEARCGERIWTTPEFDKLRIWLAGIPLS